MEVQKGPGAKIGGNLICIKSHCELGSGAKCSNEFIIKEPIKFIKGQLALLHWTVSFCAEEQTIVCADHFPEKIKETVK